MKHPMQGQATLIVEDVADYRAAISEVVKPGDVVLEVGCHEGITTRRIAQEVGSEGLVYGIDTSNVCIERANTAYEALPNLHFAVADALHIPSLRKLSPDRPFEVIFLDISGSRDLETLIPLMESYEFALKPRLIVCKSFRLKRLYLNCTLLNYHPAAPGEKMDGDLAGHGEWVKPEASERFPIRKTARVKMARGVLPRDAAGCVDTKDLAENAKCNLKLDAWGSGRDRRREKTARLRDQRRDAPEEREKEVAINVLRGEEEGIRAAIGREYSATLLKLCRTLRTNLRTAYKETKHTCTAVLHWSKPVGHISWTIREEEEEEVPEQKE